MRDINTIFLTGRAVADPVLKYFDKEGQQRAVCRFTIACSRTDDITDFINVACYGGLAENVVSKYLVKGTKITVKGRLKIDQYTNKDGVKINTHEVEADDVVLPDKPKFAA